MTPQTARAEVQRIAYQLAVQDYHFAERMARYQRRQEQEACANGSKTNV